MPVGRLGQSQLLRHELNLLLIELELFQIQVHRNYPVSALAGDKDVDLATLQMLGYTCA